MLDVIFFFYFLPFIYNEGLKNSEKFIIGISWMSDIRSRFVCCRCPQYNAFWPADEAKRETGIMNIIGRSCKGYTCVDISFIFHILCIFSFVLWMDIHLRSKVFSIQFTSFVRLFTFVANDKEKENEVLFLSLMFDKTFTRITN